MSRTVSFGLALFLGAAILVGISFWGETASAQRVKDDKSAGRLPPNWRQLGLSKDQIQQIYQIQSEYRAKVKALEEQIKKLEQDEHQAMVRVLTATQREKLRKIYLEKAGLSEGSATTNETKDVKKKD